MVCYCDKNIFMKHLREDVCICDNECTGSYSIDDYSIKFKNLFDYRGDY